MSDQSPTVGELKRENEDLEARVEELEIRLGLLDVDEEKSVDELLEDAGVDVDAIVEELEEGIAHKQEQEFRRRSTGGPR